MPKIEWMLTCYTIHYYFNHQIRVDVPQIELAIQPSIAWGSSKFSTSQVSWSSPARSGPRAFRENYGFFISNISTTIESLLLLC